VLSSTSFRKERIESIIAPTDGLVTGHLSIWLDTMFQTEQFPARIADLYASLSNVDADSLTHGYN
jgi:hypothetical protein